MFLSILCHEESQYIDNTDDVHMENIWRQFCSSILKHSWSLFWLFMIFSVFWFANFHIII